MADISLNPGAWTDPRMALANQLLQSSADATPVRSWTQELARALAGPTGAWEMNHLNAGRTKALSAIGDQAFGVAPAGQQASPAPDGGQSLLGGIGDAIFGKSKMHAQAPSDPNLVASAGSPLASSLDSDAPSVSSGGTTYGAKFTQPPQSGGASPVPGGPPQPQNQPMPQGSPNTAQPPIPGAPADNSPVGKQMAYALAVYNTGKSQGGAYGNQLMEQAQQMRQAILQKQADAQITAGGKLLGDGKILNPDNTVTAVGNYAKIDADNAALKDQTENPALIARAGGISHAEQGDKMALALAPKQFDLQTATQTVQTPGGPRLMTNAQAMEYARSGSLPGGAGDGVGGAATGALQDPKVKEAQIAEVTGSQKRFADAQTRLQNLSQLKTIFANPNLITGAHGDEIQAIRGSLLQGYRALGKEPPQDLVQGVGSADALKSAANALAIEVSKDEGVGTPRVSIFNAISQNKPGLTTSPQGNLVRVLAMEQAARRESDFGNFAPSYYQQHGNYNKQDAEAAFAKLHPNDEYVSQIYPKNPDEFAQIPVGAMFVAPDGQVHTKVK